MTSRYQQEMQYIRAYLTEEEITRRVEALNKDSRRASLARWEGNGPMTVKELRAWVTFAESVGAVAVDSYNIYRDKTDEELRTSVVDAEYHKREYVDRDMPDDLSDPVAAAAEYSKTL